MNIPSRRKLGAIALILAGIAAVGVPLYLWHGGSSPQGTSPKPTTTSGNNNNGNTAGTTNPNTNNGGSSSNTGASNNSGGDKDNGSGGSGSNSCSDPKSTDSDPSTSSHSHTKDNDNDQGNAFGVLKNKMDTTVALVKSMGAHNSAFHEHHDTKTDNHTVHNDPDGVGHGSIDHDPTCNSSEDETETD